MSKRMPLNTPFISAGNEIGQIHDFWSWAYSELQSNLNRSILGEYIVAIALGVADGVRKEWGAYDLDFGNIKVEVKTSAYIQSWEQRGFSKPVFSIRPARSLGDGNGNNYDPECKRRADVYVFCLHACIEAERLNPLDLDQWEFYCVSTKLLDGNMPNQKTLSLATLQRLTDKLHFNELKDAVLKGYHE